MIATSGFDSPTDWTSTDYSDCYTSTTTITYTVYKEDYDLDCYREEIESIRDGWYNPIKVPLPKTCAIRKRNRTNRIRDVPKHRKK